MTACWITSATHTSSSPSWLMRCWLDRLWCLTLSAVQPGRSLRDRLAADSEPAVRKNVARNPSTADSILESLRPDPGIGVSGAAVKAQRRRRRSI